MALEEHPWDRARCLARELSMTLDELGGRYRAVIMPANAEKRPVLFEIRPNPCIKKCGEGADLPNQNNGRFL